MPKPTKQQIESCIASLEWLKYILISNKKPKEHTPKYTINAYLKNAIEILNELKESKK